MTITNGYCTLAELKTHLGISDTTEDTRLEGLVEGVSRAIDDYCLRVFYTSSSDETKYFTPFNAQICYVDDLLSITTISIDDTGDRSYPTSLETSDYDLEPYNSSPYSMIVISPTARYGFPVVRKGVKIVGRFGFSSVPKPVKEACLLMCARIYHRKGAPFGVAGSAELGELRNIREIDPDVKTLLSPYKRMI